MSGKRHKQGVGWAEAKRRCRLSNEDVRMARELGFKPRSLIKNISAKSQPWKLPVRRWVQQLHAERFGDGSGLGEESVVSGDDEHASCDLHIEPSVQEDEELLPQWDTVNEEPYFIRQSDGRVFSLEEAGRYSLQSVGARRPRSVDGMESMRGTCPECLGPNAKVDADTALDRKEQFHLAAEAVASAMGAIPEVKKIVLFGSVARLSEQDVAHGDDKCRPPRLGCFHACKDVDLAVWIDSLNPLRELQKARSRALNDLLAERDIGVAHHQVDVFLMDGGTDGYLGRLCCFTACPKGKAECRTPGCGAVPFLRQHERFIFDWAEASIGSVLLYARDASVE